MADVIALLQQLGFSEYESRAYLALLQRNPLNGYELAKLSRLPRANIYAVLQKLEERGAIVRLDQLNGMRYAPIAPTELTQRVATRFQQTLNNDVLAVRTRQRLQVDLAGWYIQHSMALTAVLNELRSRPDQ